LEVGWTPGSAEANRTYPEPSGNPSVHEIRAARSGGTSPVIADNYAIHKHPAVTRWLDRHTRFHMHYTPTSSSWMNLVERFFRDLTEFITEKGFASSRELADAIIAFLAERDKNPRRYVWKAKGEDILRKINAARQALAARQPQGNAISKTAH
jgi:DDE superfamily endonuclease